MFPYIMMHMRGNPQTMQTLTNYEDIVKKCCFIFPKSSYGKKFKLMISSDPALVHKTIAIKLRNFFKDGIV
jgi:dihydropteroate synthase